MSEMELDTAVVGAGIAGLYATWRLAHRKEQSKIGLFEALDRFGGRIETLNLDGFLAECGPMRFEKGKQVRVMSLLDELELSTEAFTPYAAPSVRWPQYDLPHGEIGPAEKPYNTLELLKLGLIRIFQQSDWRSPGNPDDPRDPLHGAWLAGLTEADFQRMKEGLKLPSGAPVYQVGFYNVLSGVLSPAALMKIRDQGTFFHMMGDNPNAINWTTFWLRALSSQADSTLVKIAGGSQMLPTTLVDRLRQSFSNRVTIQSRHRLTTIGTEPDGRIRLQFHTGSNLLHVVARHVILALPRSPLKRLSQFFPEPIQADLDSVMGLSLVKCFFVTPTPWWREDTPPQRNASLIPSREIHYWYRPADGKGMVMVYSDRPGTEFWKVYLKGTLHDRAEVDGHPELRQQFFRYFATDLLDPKAPPITNLTTCAIRDWSQEPYGAGAHTWRPGAKSWEVIPRLTAFHPADHPGGPTPRLHICGETFTDYQGIEGALRSTELALETVD
jgi:monoamine oxidase